MSAEEIEKEYMAFCASVKEDALKIMAMASNGRDYQTIVCAALTLSDTANARLHQYRMQKERQDKNRYDLAALRVDASAPSNSETGFEDRG